MRPLTVHFYTAFVHEQGTYFRFHNLARGLMALGQNVTIFACDQDWHTKPRTEDRDGVKYQILPVLPTARIFDATCDPFSALRNAIVRRPRCDVAHLFQPFPAAALAWRWADARTRFWDWDDLWNHETERRPLRPLRHHWSKPVTRWMEQTLPKRADHVTAIDHYLADLAATRHARKVSLLYNPSPILSYGDKQEIRLRLGLDPSALYVGFMGFTVAEMEWCLTAVAQNKEQFPKLRFAVCGPAKDALSSLPAGLEDIVDCLGRLSQKDAREFASALDLALLPLEDTPFNRSRFPVKFSEYLMAGAPVLCSEVGECARLSPAMPWVFGAGQSRRDWLASFPKALETIQRRQAPVVDVKAIQEMFSEPTVCHDLITAYRAQLND